jgi:hypothetical protein
VIPGIHLSLIQPACFVGTIGYLFHRGYNRLINKLILLFFGLCLALSACQGRGATTETPASTSDIVVTTESFAATPLPATQPAGLPQATGEAGPGLTAGCTVVSAIPTPGPTEQSLFPPVGEKEWTQGPDTAEVTIIEYSDFM